MKNDIAIHWFCQDLRLTDNPALSQAAKHGAVLAIYILDDQNAGPHSMGAASRVWVHHSLSALNTSLDGNLCVYRGNPQGIIKRLIKRHNVSAVYWNRCYEPWRIGRDTQIKTHLKTMGTIVQTFNASLLWEPWEINKSDGTPYKVFTPFYRKGCLQAPAPRSPMPKPKNAVYMRSADENGGITSLGLLPDTNWYKALIDHWPIGETGAYKQFEIFCETSLQNYKQGRDFPQKPFVSRLAPHLHFGEISPNQLWYGARVMGDSANIDHFCSELGWREFAHNQLYHNPDLPHKNLQSKFDAFPWADNKAQLHPWQCGQTGIPMVDAGMRELWQTGYMHNRLRMVVGSFLVKNLRLHWHHGERWFWDTLFDADLANNSAGWQWIAGCGADAAPYFRIFNPVTQGQRFDPDGGYIRTFIPKIAALPDKHIFAPWLAPDGVLSAAGVTLGQTYPAPIIDLKTSREAALAAFKSLKVNS